jgi:hypothetical protein
MKNFSNRQEYFRAKPQSPKENLKTRNKVCFTFLCDFAPLREMSFGFLVLACSD